MGIGPNSTLPPAPGGPQPQIDRFRLLDTYVAWGIGNWQLSFGKETLWWGPGQNGPLMVSDNVEPMTMVRLDRVSPMKLPFMGRFLGPVRTQMFIGRLSGHHFVKAGPNLIGSYSQSLTDQPYVLGQKFSFKPTANLEIGISRTGVFGGPGFPVTLGRLKTVLFTVSGGNTHTNTGDPGDRRTGFDFQYRVPGLRKWLVLYNDSLAEDEVNPLGYPRRSAMNPGIYMPQLPKLPQMDFRAEAAYTDLPGLIPSGYFYYNLRYVNGYTNDGHVIGNWVGRQGKALQISSRYWFSPVSNLQILYRTLKASPETGREGTQQDVKVAFDWKLSSTLKASGWVQHERWNFPVLAPIDKSGTSVSFQLEFTPKLSWTR